MFTNYFIINNNMRQYLILDLARFTLALGVVIWHYVHFTMFYNIENRFNFTYGGVFLVPGFWVISGVIFQFYYNEKIKNNLTTFKEFFILRFSRLYPLHFVTLILVLILQLIYHYVSGGNYFIYQYNDIKHFLMNLFFINYFKYHHYSFNAPIWSVCAEVLVYFLFFFLNKRHISILGHILLIILTFALQSKYQYVSDIIKCSRFFFVGCILSILIDSNYYLSRVKSINIPFSEVLGNLTYSSYLIHFPIQLVIMIFITFFALDGKGLVDSYWFFLFYIFFTFLLSYFVYKYFEMPMQKYLRKKLLK